MTKYVYRITSLQKFISDSSLDYPRAIFVLYDWKSKLVIVQA